ncbi:MAG: hypothetical protein JST28_21060 [Acidobacteria bacterium]|nr:hypothetical protein [Acidobacteriota bacterium]
MESRFVGCLRLASRAILTLVFLGLSSLSARADNACPWMNEASASGLLGGEAVGSYQAAPQTGGAATCTFTQRDDKVTRTLVIQVTTTPDAAEHLRTARKICTSDPLPLQAIGNEATECAANVRGQSGEQVLGRVRDQLFMIRISSSRKDDPVLTRSALKTMVSSAAELVAGNLF